MRVILSLFLLTFLPGCVASVVADVVTAPVKVASKAVDVMTTSQSEADQKRGRALRKQEERLGKLARQHDKAQRKCDNGDDDACHAARGLSDEIAEEQRRRI